jgi:hypothetical protein
MRFTFKGEETVLENPGAGVSGKVQDTAAGARVKN